MNARGDRVLRLVPGDQLFPLEHAALEPAAVVFMAEDIGLCTDHRHHQQKIVLFLAAMRCYRNKLEAAGHCVHYTELTANDARSYEHKLLQVARETGATTLEFFEIENKPMEGRIRALAREHGLRIRELPSPMFLTGRDEFESFVAGKSQVRMAAFYKYQRRRLNILVDPDGQPVGGRWSFDDQNRKKLPAALMPPPRPEAAGSHVVSEVIDLVGQMFAEHPGSAQDFSWPVTHEGATDWLQQFLREGLSDFGPYEDAISTRSTTVFHSLLSPMMNMGLLTPGDVVRQVTDFAAQRDIPLPSLEGFYRQVIGWREFVRGVYRQFGDQQEGANFWKHERELSDDWYTGTTGIPILDDTIRNALQDGWTHHIPRLMVVANLMILCEIRPAAAYRWFMEMFVDSADWVMGPNVYGMGIFSDGGIIMTKPYICGSNYLLKMSDYKRGDWCDTVDGLYWRFIAKHRGYFSSNPRLSLSVRGLDRLADDRNARITFAAERFLSKVTRPSSA